MRRLCIVLQYIYLYICGACGGKRAALLAHNRRELDSTTAPMSAIKINLYCSFTLIGVSYTNQMQNYSFNWLTKRLSSTEIECCLCRGRPEGRCSDDSQMLECADGWRRMRRATLSRHEKQYASGNRQPVKQSAGIPATTRMTEQFSFQPEVVSKISSPEYHHHKRVIN